jgi:nucleoid DNA-binding protein
MGEPPLSQIARRLARAGWGASGGEEVTLAGFGRFKVADRAERRGTQSRHRPDHDHRRVQEAGLHPGKTIREALNPRAAAE